MQELSAYMRLCPRLFLLFILRGQKLACTLAITVKDEGGHEVRSQYAPRPDLVFEKDGFPRLFVGIDSKCNERDKIRMLLQMAYFLKNGSIRRTERTGSLFILGLYLRSRWRAELYVMAQPLDEVRMRLDFLKGLILTYFSANLLS